MPTKKYIDLKDAENTIFEKELLEFNFVSVPCEVQSTEGTQNVKKCHNRFNSSCYIQGLFYNRMIKMEEEDQADLDPLVREIGHARRYPSYPRAPAQGNQMLQSWRGDHFEAPSFA